MSTHENPLIGKLSEQVIFSAPVPASCNAIYLDQNTVNPEQLLANFILEPHFNPFVVLVTLLTTSHLKKRVLVLDRGEFKF